MQQRCLLLFGPAAFSPFALAHGLPRTAPARPGAAPRPDGRSRGRTGDAFCGGRPLLSHAGQAKPAPRCPAPQAPHSPSTVRRGSTPSGRLPPKAHTLAAGLLTRRLCLPGCGLRLLQGRLPPSLRTSRRKSSLSPRQNPSFPKGPSPGPLLPSGGSAQKVPLPRGLPLHRGFPSPRGLPLPRRASLPGRASPPPGFSSREGFPSRETSLSPGGLPSPGGFPSPGDFPLPRGASPPRGEPSLSQREPARPCRLPRPLTWAVRPCGAPAGRRRQRPCPCPCLCRCRRLRRTAAGRATGKTL